MYIQHFCPFVSILFFDPPIPKEKKTKTSVALIFLCIGDTYKCKNNTFSYWVAVTNQLRSANLLYPRLAGVAFMYKLRPLDDNPIEHTGLQYARQCSNTKRCLYFCHLSLSLATSLKVNSHHNGKQGLPRPVQILGECFSHICSSRLKNSHDKKGKHSHLCP